MSHGCAKLIVPLSEERPVQETVVSSWHFLYARRKNIGAGWYRDEQLSVVGLHGGGNWWIATHTYPRRRVRAHVNRSPEILHRESVSREPRVCRSPRLRDRSDVLRPRKERTKSES